MEYPSIQWSQQNLEDDLKTLEEYAIAVGLHHRAYYKNNSAFKRTWAKGLRILAIVAGAIAGLLPIVSQMTSGGNNFKIDPAWSTIAVTIAITAIGFDRFFGFSSGWIRFVTTEIKIEAKIEQLRLSIENEKFSWQGQPPTFEKAKATLALLGDFLSEVSEIVKDETSTWVVEFQNALQKFNDEMNVKEETTKLGGIKVTIENGEKCNEGLVIHVEGQQPVNLVGSSYSINNLYPKIYRVSVIGSYFEDNKGQKVKKQLQDETLINVTAGAITDLTLKLQ